VEWLELTTEPSLKTKCSHGFKTKNGEERPVPLATWLHDRLRDNADRTTGYLLNGDESERAAAARRAVQWLRLNGFQDFGKPLHFLRAIAACRFLASYSLVEVMRILDHVDATTTLTSYGDRPLSKTLAMLWDEPLPFAAKSR
jgi:integrase